MARTDYPVTPAVRFLRERQIPLIPHLYRYQEHGGTSRASAMLEVPEHQVIKTLVMETDGGDPLIILMHGDREVSTRQLARFLEVKHVEPCEPETAHRYTGYLVGGTSPFGTRRDLPVYVERSIFDLPSIFINGGKRGFLVEITPGQLREALSVTEVEVAV